MELQLVDLLEPKKADLMVLKWAVMKVDLMAAMMVGLLDKLVDLMVEK